MTEATTTATTSIKMAIMTMARVDTTTRTMIVGTKDRVPVKALRKIPKRSATSP